MGVKPQPPDASRHSLTTSSPLAGQDFASQNYGELPLNQSQERHGRTYASLEDVKAENDGKDIFFSARIQTSRTPSAKFVFLTLRHAFFCVQAVLAQAPEKVSKQM